MTNRVEWFDAPSVGITILQAGDTCGHGEVDPGDCGILIHADEGAIFTGKPAHMRSFGRTVAARCEHAADQREKMDAADQREKMDAEAVRARAALATSKAAAQRTRAEYEDECWKWGLDPAAATVERLIDHVVAARREEGLL